MRRAALCGFSMTTPTLQIRIYGDPVLRKKSQPVKVVGPGERLLIKAMIATMKLAKGVGLAAPQVGINQRIFVADVGDGPVAFINPKIVKKSGAGVLEEGCLSIPGVTVEIKRAQEVLVRYTDEENQLVEQLIRNLLARVVQHETDHLDGKLIVDYVKGKDAQKKIEEALKEIPKNKGSGQ